MGQEGCLRLQETGGRQPREGERALRQEIALRAAHRARAQGQPNGRALAAALNFSIELLRGGVAVPLIGLTHGSHSHFSYIISYCNRIVMKNQTISR